MSGSSHQLHDKLSPDWVSGLQRGNLMGELEVEVAALPSDIDWEEIDATFFTILVPGFISEVINNLTRVHLIYWLYGEKTVKEKCC